MRRFPDLDLHSLSGTFTFNGKQLSACVPSLELHNRVVRLRNYALPGGMPAPDFAAMRRDVLMAEAKAIGVVTHREITKADGSKYRTWRFTAEVVRDCVAAWESRHPPVLEGPVSSSAASNQSASSAPPVAPVDLDTQPQLLADLATLSTRELRKACQARGFTTKCQQKEQLLQRLAAVTAMQPKTSSGSASTHASVSGVAKTSGSHVSSASVSLRSYFTLRSGPAPIPALAASALAQSPDGKLSEAIPKLRRRIALRPAWCYSKEKRDRHRKRMATEAAKAETRKRMATEEAKAETRKRMATEAAKAETRKRKGTEAAKAKTRKRMATVEAKAETRKRMATEAAKARDRARKATLTAKVKDRARKVTLTAKAKDRARKATPKARMEQAQWRAARRLEQRAQETHRVLQARAQRQEEALTSTGTWPVTAVHIAAMQGSDPRVPSLPPAFAALHQDGCLAFVRDMYEPLA